MPIELEDEFSSRAENEDGRGGGEEEMVMAAIFGCDVCDVDVCDVVECGEKEGLLLLYKNEKLGAVG